MTKFAELTVIAPGILHIDLNFTRRTLPYSYNFESKQVLHIKDGNLIVSPLSDGWLRRFAYQMQLVAKEEK